MNERLDDLDSYDYDLPRELIAQYPLANRSDSRLMLIERASGRISHHHVRDLDTILRAGDLLIVNDSKVIPARLTGFRTATRGRWEGLYLQSLPNGLIELLNKTRGRMQVGETITLRDREGRETQKLVVCAPPEAGHVVVRPEPAAEVDELLDRCGRVPLPPYIRDGQMVDADLQTYQTVYARHRGSVAAPTAGLHFTADLVQRLKTANIGIGAVTLHVGLGTFQPVKATKLDEHQMHSERAQVSEGVVKKVETTKTAGGRVIAVGTTSVRTLEADAKLHDGKLVPWTGETDLFIRPGFPFHVIDGMLTNFHLPKSTLIVLVSAFAGYDLTMQAYREAIEQKYRFYSYGDCMLIV